MYSNCTAVTQRSPMDWSLPRFSQSSSDKFHWRYAILGWVPWFEVDWSREGEALSTATPNIHGDPLHARRFTNLFNHWHLTHNSLRVERTGAVDDARSWVLVNVLLSEHHAVQIAYGTANAVPELYVVLNATRAQVSPVDMSGVTLGTLMLGLRFCYWGEGGVLITTE